MNDLQLIEALEVFGPFEWYTLPFVAGGQRLPFECDGARVVQSRGNVEGFIARLAEGEAVIEPVTCSVYRKVNGVWEFVAKFKD